ncbi:MAG: hypothetical protein MZU84_08490 [Sphingobacterium sp.]|nr:hypothetical protein [Sphingobacterium sp.]
MPMKPNRSLVYAAFLFIALSLLAAGPAPQAQDPACPTCGPAAELEGCTVIMVGKAASTDGSVMTTHTCDCGECDWTWRYIPAADHKPGDDAQDLPHQPVRQLGARPGPEVGGRQADGRHGDPRAPAHARPTSTATSAT